MALITEVAHSGQGNIRFAWFYYKIKLLNRKVDHLKVINSFYMT